MASLEHVSSGKSKRRWPSTRLTLFVCVVAVETLRRLILHSLLPCRDPDPEEDLTPTSSVVGTNLHWDSALSSQDVGSQEVPPEPAEGHGAMEPLGHLPAHSESGRAGPEAEGRQRTVDPLEEAELRWCKNMMEAPVERAGAQEAEGAVAVEGQGSYKVVRKGSVRALPSGIMSFLFGIHPIQEGQGGSVLVVLPQGPLPGWRGNASAAGLRIRIMGTQKEHVHPGRVP